jgi:hypothetical protein
MVIEMRKLKNVRLLTNAPATNAPATNEDNTMALHLDLEQFIGLAVDYNVAINKAESYKMAMKPYLARYISAGYTSISSGPKGKGQPPKPKTNELSYVEIKGLFDAKCTNNEPPIEYSKEATASGKSPYSNALNQFIQNFKLALQTGEWGNNSSRDKKAIELAVVAVNAENSKEKSKKGTRTPSVFDAKKIADTMSGKYTAAQMKSIIAELQALVA